MLEEILHDSGVIISAARCYQCNERISPLQGHAVPTSNPFYAKDPRGHRDINGEIDCAICTHGPLLWDQHVYMAYTLEPFIITEEEL